MQQVYLLTKEEPHKLCQKDIDARWTKKNNAIYYGYKNHVKADVKTKLIEKYKVTDASVHDSQTTEELLTEKDEGQPFYADSAYTGEKQAIKRSPGHEHGSSIYLVLWKTA